jgi:hypothetical protein
LNHRKTCNRDGSQRLLNEERMGNNSRRRRARWRSLSSINACLILTSHRLARCGPWLYSDFAADSGLISSACCSVILPTTKKVSSKMTRSNDIQGDFLTRSGVPLQKSAGVAGGRKRMPNRRAPSESVPPALRLKCVERPRVCHKRMYRTVRCVLLITALRHVAVCPPSTMRSAPVMKELASESMKIAGPAECQHSPTPNREEHKAPGHRVLEAPTHP